ncbi:MAG: PhoPQ-activated pathogenicity [Planctomycetota bacterium]|nr:MAG: PhoPQ-activated pathogenicity [Planctomycetota bacterium]
MSRLPLHLVRTLAVLVGLMFVASARGEEPTALDKYVAEPDPAYRWELVDTIEGRGFTTYVIEMVSQTYLTTEEVNRTEWKHWMVMTKPDDVQNSTGLLVIGGGSNGGDPPKGADPLTAQLALGSKSVITELKMVPNQPLVFKGETRKRKEDAIIAYTWDKYLRTGDEKWPLRLPMTKAAVRALDTITAFCASDEGGKIKVDKFVVAGGSKRGWTTWTTAAVDKRVIGIAPIVIDMLNVVPSFEHHWRAYGFWAPAVGDYVAENIMDWSGSPQYAKLMKIVEPYSYRHRFTMPKYILNATGDQFFLPTSSQFYYDDLPEPKLLRYVPNADHSMRGTDVPATLLSFYNSVVAGKKLPEYSWKVGDDNSLHVTTADKPAAVKLWHATNPDARDFRVDTIGKVWKSQDLEPQADGTYVGKVDKPEEGFTAFMVELTYDNNPSPPLKVTTQVNVVPDELPFEYEQPTPPVEVEAAAGAAD